LLLTLLDFLVFDEKGGEKFDLFDVFYFEPFVDD